MTQRGILKAHTAFDVQPYDIIGIGFGPSNIAVAIALREMLPDAKILFLEKKPEFCWHRGMLIKDATVQVSFLKDLVTFRNPTSEFTFLNYLNNKGRLSDFANLKRFFPSREEFNDYFQWCAEKFNLITRYGHEVVQLDLTNETPGRKPFYSIKAQTTEGAVEFSARSVVYAGGLIPTFPNGICSNENVFHTHAMLDEMDVREIPDGSHFTVAGGGQSAAEVADYLLDQDKGYSVTAIVSRYGYMPSDDSSFVNEIFNPEHVEEIFNATEEGRQRIRDLHASTNYAAVDNDVIDRLYWKWYQDKVRGDCRFTLLRMCYLMSTRKCDNGVEVSYRDLLNESVGQLKADYLVCATGFEPFDPVSLMSSRLSAFVEYGVQGKPQYNRNYSLRFNEALTPPFYVLGSCEETHGLSATLLSNMACRSGEVVSDLVSYLSVDTGETHYACP